jgi:hypothetical protein
MDSDTDQAGQQLAMDLSRSTITVITEDTVMRLQTVMLQIIKKFSMRMIQMMILSKIMASEQEQAGEDHQLNP